jgi:hypothetical protein
MKTRATTEAATVAKLIRADLKAAGIAARVTCKNYSGGDSVRVYIIDELPATVKAVEAGLGKYQAGYFDGMQDLYVYTNRQGPTVKFLFVEADYSPSIRQAAWEYLCNWLAGFEGAPASEKDAGSFRNVKAGDYGDRLLYRVLRGSLGHFWASRKPRQKLAA